MRASKRLFAKRRQRRGYTLVELMVVIVIVGILATVGTVWLREHIFASKSTEAVSVIQAIRGAQEQWRAETQSYLDVSTSLTAWYPTDDPGREKHPWDQPSGNDYANWRLLNPAVTGPVQFGYSTIAGSAGEAIPDLEMTTQPGFKLPTEPWFIIQATADVDEDGVRAIFAASSFTGELYTEEPGE
jgi:prepilin-type N-terminal cleavage/methylation domain-containing protein